MDDLREQIEELLPEGVTYEEVLSSYQDAWDKADASERELMDLAWRGSLASELTLEGWKHFYWCMTRREYPKAHYAIIKALIEAVETGRAKMIQAWRGFGKSTDLVFFVAWLVGARPSGSTAIIRINDTKAQLTGDLIAEIIETHKGWKATFPNIIPDKKAGWSSEKGYNVIDTNVTGLPDSDGFASGYENWRQMCLSDHPTESSLTSAGIESGVVIGLHPTNGMYFDDLHDEKNTRSAAEMQKVVDIFENNIIPTWFTPSGMPTIACVCTPWDSKRDAYHSMLKTGLFDLVKIPILTEDENGEPFAPFAEMEKYGGKKYVPTWPKNYPLERVLAIFEASAQRFMRMYMLDDKAASEIGYVYRTFPYTDIEKNWPLTIGVDPNAVVSGISSGKGVSHFAMSFVQETPFNTMVVSGGYVRKVTSDVGEQALADYARTHPSFRASSIESNGAGALFASTVARNHGLIIHPHTVGELGPGRKIVRQFQFLESMLSNGILLVSDEPNNDYLTVLKSALERYPNIRDDEPEMDVLDSLCMAVLDIPKVWSRVHTNIVSGVINLDGIIVTERAYGLGSYSYLRG